MDIKQYLRGIIRCHVGPTYEFYNHVEMTMSGKTFRFIGDKAMNHDGSINLSLMDACIRLVENVPDKDLRDPDAQIKVKDHERFIEFEIIITED